MKNSILICLLSFMCFTSVNAQTIQEARKLTDNEQYENASSIYQSLISKNPNDVNIYYYYAENLLLSDNPDSASLIFELGNKVSATSPFMKIGKAKLLIDKINIREAKAASDMDPSNAESRARYQEALANIQQAFALIDEATLNTKDINVLIEAAETMVHYKNKDTEKAKTILDQAMKIDNKNIEVFLLYGDVYTELNNGTLAADYYNKALDLNKSSARAIVSKGKLYKRSTNYEGAAREFDNAISIEPSYAPAYRELGETYIKMGKLDKAKENYKKYLELVKNNCTARIRYATFLYIGKNYAEALSELNLASQRCDPNNQVMLRLFMYLYFENKEYEKGLEKVNQLFKLVSPDKRISKDYEYYGKLLIATDQDSLGIDQLQKAFELEPSRIDLLFDMGTARISLNQYQEAINLLKQKIATGKDVKTMDYYTLGRAYYYNKQFVEADSTLMKVNELSPKWTSGWLMRAKINTQIDSTSEAGLAKPFYEKVIETALLDSGKTDFLAKHSNSLFDAYGYLAYYSLLKKDYVKSEEYLRKQLEYTVDPEEKKRIEKGIDQLKNDPKKGKTK